MTGRFRRIFFALDHKSKDPKNVADGTSVTSPGFYTSKNWQHTAFCYLSHE